MQITGQEEAMYQVKVIEDCKGRKNDLPVKVGDTVSIIRTDNCPKGKWLAKDSNNKCEQIIHTNESNAIMCISWRTHN